MHGASSDSENRWSGRPRGRAQAPPLRSGELSAHLDEPTRGFLRVTSLKASDYAAYVDELTELGFAAENGFLQKQRCVGCAAL